MPIRARFQEIGVTLADEPEHTHPTRHDTVRTVCSCDQKSLCFVHQIPIQRTDRGAHACLQRQSIKLAKVHNELSIGHIRWFAEGLALAEVFPEAALSYL